MRFFGKGALMCASVAVASLFALSPAAVSEKADDTALSIEVREVFDFPVDGYLTMELANPTRSNEERKVFYVSPQAEFTTEDIAEIEMDYDPASSRGCLTALVLKEVPRRRLMDYTAGHRDGMLGLLIDGELYTTALIRDTVTNGKIATASLSGIEAEELVKRFYKMKLE